MELPQNALVDERKLKNKGERPLSDFLTARLMNENFQYPKVNQPYMFDSTARKSVPCQATARGAANSISFLLLAEEALDLWTKAKVHFNSCAARNPKLGSFEAIHSYKKGDNGSITFTARRKCMTTKGYPSQPIPVVDGNLRPLEDLGFWSGSTGNVKFAMWPSHNQSNNQWGISLLLESVQVVHAIFGEGGADGGQDWGVIPGATIVVPKTPSDGSVPAHIIDQVETVGEQINDEIPF